MIGKKELANRFTYHAPTPEQVETYEAIRTKALAFGNFIDKVVPDGRQKSLAATALEEVVMRANAALAQHVPDAEAAAARPTAEELGAALNGEAPVKRPVGRPRKVAAAAAAPAVHGKTEDAPVTPVVARRPRRGSTPAS